MRVTSHVCDVSDAERLDDRIRANPEAAYDYQELFGDLLAQAAATPES
jgi:hypothetical protein